MRTTKGFSYDPEKDKDVIQHISKQPNGSYYIWELVRKDMRSNNLEDTVNKLIEKYLQGCELQAGKEKKVIEIDANEINNILNI